MEMLVCHRRWHQGRQLDLHGHDLADVHRMPFLGGV